MSAYIKEKLNVLQQLEINLTEADKKRLQSAKTEIQADAIARSIIVNAD